MKKTVKQKIGFILIMLVLIIAVFAGYKAVKKFGFFAKKTTPNFAVSMQLIDTLL